MIFRADVIDVAVIDAKPFLPVRLGANNGVSQPSGVPDFSDEFGLEQFPDFSMVNS